MKKPDPKDLPREMMQFGRRPGQKPNGRFRIATRAEIAEAGREAAQRLKNAGCK